MPSTAAMSAIARPSGGSIADRLATASVGLSEHPTDVLAGEGEDWVVAGPNEVIFRVDSETLPIA